MWLAALYYLFGTVLVPPCSHGNGGALFVYRGIDAHFKRARSMDLPHRIAYWSALFLGTPYTSDPLGEGRGEDPDPIFDPCHVDCETYVEQVLALAFSGSLPEAMRWLSAMRYHGCRVEAHARYFTMAGSWIPGNLKLGYLRAIRDLKTKEMRRYVRPQGRWREPFKSRLVAMGPLAPHGWQRIRYVPLAWIPDQMDTLRKHVPAVGMVVAVKQLGNPFMVTHMGLVLESGGTLVFRHASSLHRRVMDVPVKKYLKFLEGYVKEGYRPVAGMAFFEITEPGPLRCP